MLDGFPLSAVERCRLTERVIFSVGVKGGEDKETDLFDASTAVSSSDTCDGKDEGSGQSRVSSNS